MLKSTVTAVLAAAAVVAGKNYSIECSPVVSGPLQLFNFNSTNPPSIVGVNATKSGAHLATSFVKKPLDVAYEECTEKQGNTTLFSTRVVAKENKELCLKHERGPGRNFRLLVLDECKKHEKDNSTKELNFHAVYGKGMKGQNATLVALHSEGEYEPAWGLPFVQIYPHFHDLDSDKNVTTDVVGISTMSNVLLQIGNATEH